MAGPDGQVATALPLTRVIIRRVIRKMAVDLALPRLFSDITDHQSVSNKSVSNSKGQKSSFLILVRHLTRCPTVSYYTRSIITASEGRLSPGSVRSLTPVNNKLFLTVEPQTQLRFSPVSHRAQFWARCSSYAVHQRHHWWSKLYHATVCRRQPPLSRHTWPTWPRDPRSWYQHSPRLG